MHDPNGRLEPLVRALDASRGEPSLTQLADMLASAQLTVDHVAP